MTGPDADIKRRWLSEMLSKTLRRDKELEAAEMAGWDMEDRRSAFIALHLLMGM